MGLTVETASVSKRKVNVQKGGNSFEKLKSTIMIIGQRDSEAREVCRKSWKKGKVGDKKS